MTLWNKIRLFRVLILLLLNPKRTEMVFRAVEIVATDPNQRVVKTLEEAALAHQEFKSMYDEGYLPEAPSVEVLSRCPTGSFGEAVSRHMRTNGLDFSIWPKALSNKPIAYLSARIYQDHDLWHALLGYGISVEDELALQAFGVAQFRSPLGVTLVAGGLLHLLAKDPLRALAAFQKINEAYSAGKKSPFLLGVKLHEMFEQPLSEVRTKLVV